MIPEQNADRLPTHLRHHLSLHRFLGDESNAPPRSAFRRLATYHGYDPLALARVQHPRLARTRLLIQRWLQSLFLVTPGNRPHGLGGHAQKARHLGRRLSLVELTKNQRPPQHPRRLPPLVQHLGNLLPIPLSKLDTHPMVGLHVPTVRPILSFHECLNRYIFTWSQTEEPVRELSFEKRGSEREPNCENSKSEFSPRGSEPCS